MILFSISSFILRRMEYTLMDSCKSYPLLSFCDVQTLKDNNHLTVIHSNIRTNHRICSSISFDPFVMLACQKANLNCEFLLLFLKMLHHVEFVFSSLLKYPPPIHRHYVSLMFHRQVIHMIRKSWIKIMAWWKVFVFWKNSSASNLSI